MRVQFSALVLIYILCKGEFVVSKRKNKKTKKAFFRCIIEAM